MVAVVTAEDRLLFLEHRIEELARSVAALEQRVDALTAVRPEGMSVVTAAAPSPPVESAPPSMAAEIPVESALPGGFTLVGRTLLVFGGAYLLRAFTAAGFLPQHLGALLAFGYALAWLGLADRDGGRGRAASAAFHGATAVLIALPLLWETTTRFHYLDPAMAGVALALFCAAVFAVAWRRLLPGIAWLIGLGAVAAAFSLIVGTRVWAPFTLDVVLLGLAGIWLAYGRGWRGLGWLLGLAASGCVLLMILVARFAPVESGIAPAAALAIGLALCLAFLASFAVRLLGQRQEVTALEAVLSALGFVIGYGGAAFMAVPAAGKTVGALGCALALACYAAAFGVIARQERRKLLLASSLAIAFLLTGSGLLLPSPALALAWAGLAIAAAAGSVLLVRVTVALHGTLYALAAALASGLAAAAGYAFAAPAETVWPALTLPALLALAAAAVECGLPVPRPAPFWKPYASATRLFQLVTFTVGAGAVVLYLLAPAVAGRPPAVDAGLLATARTFVLVASALLLGWVSRWPRFREAAWLVYPVLVLASLKLVIEDFPHGRPATLFVALALCGGAFIAAPRVMRRKS